LWLRFAYGFGIWSWTGIGWDLLMDLGFDLELELVGIWTDVVFGCLFVDLSLRDSEFVPLSWATLSCFCPLASWSIEIAFAYSQTYTTTTKPFDPSIWGRLHEPKENYAGSYNQTCKS